MNPILKVMFGLLCLVSFNAMADGSPKPGDKRYEAKLE